MNPYWLIEFYSISGLIPIPDFMKPASAGRFSLKCGSYLFIQASRKKYRISFHSDAVLASGNFIIVFCVAADCSRYGIITGPAVWCTPPSPPVWITAVTEHFPAITGQSHP